MSKKEHLLENLEIEDIPPVENQLIDKLLGL